MKVVYEDCLDYRTARLACSGNCNVVNGPEGAIVVSDDSEEEDNPNGAQVEQEVEESKQVSVDESKRRSESPPTERYNTRHSKRQKCQSE